MTARKISIAFVLKASLVLEEVLPEIEQALAKIGVEVSGVGRVTISGAISLDLFEHVFGVSPQRLQAQLPSDRDMGTPAGFYVEVALIIPPELEPFIEHISVLQPATRLSSRKSQQF